jgi:hypothetical protein
MHICIVMLCLSVAASKPSSHSLRETPLFFSVSVRPEPVLANESDTGYEFLAPDFVVLESHVHLLFRSARFIRQNGLFLSFPYVCPEPVLAK